MLLTAQERRWYLLLHVLCVVGWFWKKERIPTNYQFKRSGTWNFTNLVYCYWSVLWLL